MDKTPKPSHDILLAELELHKAEFASLRDEMSHLNQSEEQFLNFNLAALAAVLATATFVIDQKALSLFLLFALIFHVFLWEMLEATKSGERISLYLVEHLIPRVNAILTELEHETTSVFGWEIEARIQSLKPSRWIGALIPNRKWIPILSTAGLIIAYIVLAQRMGVEITAGDIGLILLNLIALIFSALDSLLTAMRATERSRRMQGAGKARP